MTLHSLISVSFPTHGSPPLYGAGLLQYLFRSFVPFPHVSEHWDHLSHELQCPCTTKQNKKITPKACNLLENYTEIFHRRFINVLYRRLTEKYFAEIALVVWGTQTVILVNSVYACAVILANVRQTFVNVFFAVLSPVSWVTDTGKSTKLISTAVVATRIIVTLIEIYTQYIPVGNDL